MNNSGIKYELVSNGEDKLIIEYSLENINIFDSMKTTCHLIINESKKIVIIFFKTL